MNNFFSINNNNSYPEIFRAGDTLDFYQYSSNYDSMYNLNLVLLSPNNKIVINSTYENQGWHFIVDENDSSNYIPGIYQVYQQYSKTDFKKTIKVGSLEILQNLDNVNSLETSENQKALNCINAVLQKRATLDQQSYSIQGRSLSRMSVADLIKLKEYFENEVVKENNGNGKNCQNGAIIRVRFDR